MFQFLISESNQLQNTVVRTSPALHILFTFRFGLYSLLVLVLPNPTASERRHKLTKWLLCGLAGYSCSMQFKYLSASPCTNTDTELTKYKLDLLCYWYCHWCACCHAAAVAQISTGNLLMRGRSHSRGGQRVPLMS